MKQEKIILGAFILLLSMQNLSSSYSQTVECVPADLKCEHLVSPLGIDCKTPRLSWRLQDIREGARQTAYKIEVGKDSSALAKGKNIIWQEKKQSGQMLTSYKGSPLKPFTKYYWSVTVWDKDKQISNKIISSFETGMLSLL